MERKDRIQLGDDYYIVDKREGTAQLDVRDSIDDGVVLRIPRSGGGERNKFNWN